MTTLIKNRNERAPIQDDEEEIRDRAAKERTLKEVAQELDVAVEAVGLQTKDKYNISFSPLDLSLNLWSCSQDLFIRLLPDETCWNC